MLRHMVHKSCQCPTDSFTEEFQTSSDINISTKTGGLFMESISMAKQLHTRLTSPSTMASIEWSDVKHAATEFCSSKNVFYGMTNHPSLFGSLTGKFRFGRCQDNVTCLTALCQL